MYCWQCLIVVLVRFNCFGTTCSLTQRLSCTFNSGYYRGSSKSSNGIGHVGLGARGIHPTDRNVDRLTYRCVAIALAPCSAAHSFCVWWAKFNLHYRLWKHARVYLTLALQNINRLLSFLCRFNCQWITHSITVKFPTYPYMHTRPTW